MKNTGYVCLMILLRMLEVKADSKNLETSFSEGGETDLEIIRAAKQLGLKVKLSSFNRKTFSKHNIPVIAKTKEDELILILGTRDEGCLILDPKESCLSDSLLHLGCSPDV